MNTPTPAQALGYTVMELAAIFETCIPFLPPIGQKNLAKAVADLRQHGQHFAGLESEVAELRVDVETLVKMWQHWMDRAEAAEARCAELEVECADLGKRHHETLIAWEAEITNTGYAEARVREAEGLLRESVNDDSLPELTDRIAAFLAARG